MPQWEHSEASAGTGVPQVGHGCRKGDPQAEQNRAPAGFS
jgi:hypothetical protein